MATYILLPALCIFLIALIIFIIWIIIRKRKEAKTSKQKREDGLVQQQTQAIVNPPDFTIPFSIRAVREQLPAVSAEKASSLKDSEMSIASNRRKHGVFGAFPTFAPNGDNQVCVHHCKYLSVVSLPSKNAVEVYSLPMHQVFLFTSTTHISRSSDQTKTAHISAM